MNDAMRAVHARPSGAAFDAAVPAGGYAWWYVDAVSDDGRDGITIIAFIGSVFSPYYAAARRRAAAALADPLEHCALNVALYGRHRRWTMTERGRGSVHATAATLAIGPSALAWDGATLTIRFDEITAPLPARVRGCLRLVPTTLLGHDYALDAAGVHRWTPLAPLARAEVELEQPRLRWRGSGYLDMNRGAVSLESAFRRWDWARLQLAGGDAAILYDVERADRSRFGLALRIGAAHGDVQRLAAPPQVRLPTSRWGVPRMTRTDAGHAATCLRSLEDGPFYARALLDTHLFGETARGVHETVSLERFRQRWVQHLLPFRVPRRARAVVALPHG